VKTGGMGKARETTEILANFQRDMRRFLYYQSYKTSLPFGEFLKPSVRTTQTCLKSFGLDELLESDAIKVILEGVLDDRDFFVERKLVLVA